MKKLLTLILFLFCLPAMAQHISISVGIPGAYIHYSDGYYPRRPYYERHRYDYDRYYYVPRPVVIYSYPYPYYPRRRFDERYERQPYIIRDERPVIYNRYPSGYNYTIGR